MKDEVIARVNHFKTQLSTEINLTSVEDYAPIAFKWKCLYQVWLIRELVLHRFVDLLDGAEVNQKEYSHIVSVILVRAACETVAVLCYVNKLMKDVVSKKLDIFEFGNLLSRLLAGNKIGLGSLEPINVINLITKTDEKYNGFLKVYEKLCEISHPNYLGLLNAYAENHIEGVYTLFGKQKTDSDTNYKLINAVMDTFEDEYNNVWNSSFNNLIRWLEKNDSKLEAKRRKKMKKQSNTKPEIGGFMEENDFMNEMKDLRKRSDFLNNSIGKIAKEIKFKEDTNITIENDVFVKNLPNLSEKEFSIKFSNNNFSIVWNINAKTDPINVKVTLNDKEFKKYIFSKDIDSALNLTEGEIKKSIIENVTEAYNAYKK